MIQCPGREPEHHQSRSPAGSRPLRGGVWGGTHTPAGWWDWTRLRGPRGWTSCWVCVCACVCVGDTLAAGLSPAFSLWVGVCVRWQSGGQVPPRGQTSARSKQIPWGGRTRLHEAQGSVPAPRCRGAAEKSLVPVTGGPCPHRTWAEDHGTWGSLMGGTPSRTFS